MVFAAVCPIAVGQEMTLLSYNHPGLVVDLGVGLWAWPIPCDADGDGDWDLIVSCPDKPSNGVWLFENRKGSTRQDPMPVFEPARRLSSTLHYVMPSYVDGTLRVLSPGLEYAEFETQGTQRPTRLSVPANFYKPQGTQTKGPKVRHNQWRYADLDGDDVLDLLVGIEDWSFYGWDDAYDEQGNWIAGPLRGFVYWHRGLGDGRYEAPVQLQFDDAGTEPIPIETFGCPSPNFIDMDGDGDLDLICGEFLDRFTYFQNTGTSRSPRFAAGRRIQDRTGSDLRMELQMIVPVAFDWDTDGDADLIVGDEDGRVAWLENTGQRNRDQVPIFEQPRYFKQRADTLKCGALATPVGFDWDGDGDDDIVSGNTAGFIEIFENLSGPRVAEPRWQAPVRLQVDGREFRVQAGSNGSIQGPAEAKWGYTTLNIADWDLDGLPDILYNSILGEVSWLKNTGTRSQPRFDRSQPIEVQWDLNENLGDEARSLPQLAWGWKRIQGNVLLTQWRTTPVVHDFNQDGLPDLAMLDTEGFLALFERRKIAGRLVCKPPVRCFLDDEGKPLRLNSRSAGGSGRRKLHVIDWNGDGSLDWLLNSKNADLLVGLASPDGPSARRYRAVGPLSDRNIEGHDVSPTTVDFDGDRIPDFLGGAEDGRFYYLRNSRRP
ncbi:MAG: VCBS repeat-containing protein [Planctomycetota bacterium]